MNIILTGFMGTGKTVVGRRIAEALRTSFVDSDHLVEKKVGHSIRTIFETLGEAKFRQMESGVLKELAQLDKTVIAVGGGALLRPENRETLQKNGIFVCLSARTNTLLDRLKDDVTRPLLAGENPEARIERLMNERQSIYALCEIQIDTNDQTIDQVADAIIQAVKPRWGEA
jgi:shikimate kinase